MTTALVPASANDDINATLRALGLMEEGQISDFNRARVNGTTFELGEDMFPSNQKTKAPAFYARILDLPDEYQGVYLDATDASIIDRPDKADKFCKSHYDKSIYPNEGGDYAMDGTACRQCPINPFIKKLDSPLENHKKCSWRGDIIFQLWDEPNGAPLDDTVWTLSLPTTGMIELKGMRKEPEKGFVSDLNFMQQLARFGIAHFSDDDAQQAITKAAMALKNGGVVVAVRALAAKSGDGSRNFAVVSMTPVAIVDSEPRAPKLAAGPATTEPKNVTPESDEDLPF